MSRLGTYVIETWYRMYSISRAEYKRATRKSLCMYATKLTYLAYVFNVSFFFLGAVFVTASLTR